MQPVSSSWATKLALLNRATAMVRLRIPRRAFCDKSDSAPPKRKALQPADENLRWEV